MNRLEQLTRRLENLIKLKEDELASANPSHGFISDCNESIAYCEKEISRLSKRKDGGIELMNGV